MPILQLDTNLSKTIIPLEFRIQTCKLIADIFNSPLHVR